MIRATDLPDIVVAVNDCVLAHGHPDKVPAGALALRRIPPEAALDCERLLKGARLPADPVQAAAEWCRLIGKFARTGRTGNDPHGVTGPHANPPGGWDAILRNAEKRPHLAVLVRNFRASGHPACLNAIMTNADSNLWLTYYTGRDTLPAETVGTLSAG